MSATTDPGAKQKNENVLIIKTKLDEREVEVWHNRKYIAHILGRFYITQKPMFVAISIVSQRNDFAGAVYIDGKDIIVKEVFE